MEHVIHCENSNYADILHEGHLVSGRDFGNSDAILSTAHKSSQLFRHGSHPYFEFTHHNPLGNADDKHMLRKRIDRQIQLRGTPGKKIFVYHHRSTSGFSKDAKDILNTGGNLLREKYSSAYSIFFTQQIIKDGNRERDFDMELVEGNQAFITLFTTNAWKGVDPDQFFARQDNDLLEGAFTACTKKFGLVDFNIIKTHPE